MALHATGEDGLDEALAARGLDRVRDPAPDGDRPADSRPRLPRLAALLG